MKNFLRSMLFLTAAVAAGYAQKWEVGVTGGASFLNNVSVTGGPASATAGFDKGAVVGAYVGFNQYKHISGEIHYAYMQSKLRLESGGTESTYSGEAHAVHYDVIFKTAKANSKVQLFAAVGVGLKVFRGTGKEAPSIPLTRDYGYFTHTQQVKAMGSFGGGAKFYISKRAFVRTEVRDYITSFPKEVITPPPGTKYGTVLHDLVPMVTIGVEM